MNSAVSGGVWVFSEVRQSAFELLAGGRALAEARGVPLSAVVIGDQDLAREHVAYGADSVYLFAPANELPLEAFASAIAGLAKDHAPDLLLMGATNRGKTVAALVAGALETGCSTESKGIATDAEGGISVDRLFFSGAGVVTETCVTRPYVVTVPMRTFKPLEEDSARTGVVTEIPFDASVWPVRVTARLPKPEAAVDVTAADAVIVAGRGFAKQEDLALAEALAKALGGVVACSRPIAEDRHWMPHDMYIGLSGKKIKPKLCVMVGCAGQLQLMAGLTDSKYIFAIDKNESALVFDFADFGIADDLYQVLPALTAAIQGLKG